MTPVTDDRDLRIEPLGDHPELVERVARWHWDEWGHDDPGGSAEAWADGLRRRSGRRSIPITWVALLGEEPVGSVALIDLDMYTHPELRPWLSGLFVAPGHRSRAIGTALVGHCEREAARLGVARLHLYTTREDFYRRLGYEVAARERYGRDEVAIMAKDLVAPA